MATLVYELGKPKKDGSRRIAILLSHNGRRKRFPTNIIVGKNDISRKGKITSLSIQKTIDNKIAELKCRLYNLYPDGRIYSEFVNRFITATKDTCGYLQNTLVDDEGNRRTLKNHVLVASAFIPRVINKMEVNHKDFNKENNTVENLEWCDRSYNMRYNYTHRENKRAKDLSPLTEEQVLLIPEMMNNGFSIKFISKLLNVGHITIRNIITHKTWKYLNLEIPTRYFIRSSIIEVSQKLYDKLVHANVDNTVLNSRVKVLESV